MPTPWHDEIDGLPTFTRYGQNIMIGGNPDRKDVDGISFDMKRYQRAVVQQLNTVAHNPVGKIVLGALTVRVMITPRNVRRWYGTQVFPFSGKYLKDKEDGSLLSISHPKHNEVAQIKNNSKRGAPVRNTGALAVEINFIPATFIPGTAFNPDRKTMFSPDGALLHELVHAIRMQRGQLDTRIFKGHQSNFLDKEEFLAVMVANMYRSAKGAKTDGLRWSYHIPDNARTMEDIGGVRHNSASFAQVFEPLLAALFLEIPKIFGDLALVSCTFNPMALAIEKFRSMPSAEIKQLARASEVFKNKEIPFWVQTER